MDDKSDKPKKQTWIYESPDNGVTVYRRPFGDYDTPREKIKDAGGWLIPDEEHPKARILSQDALESSNTGC